MKNTIVKIDLNNKKYGGRIYENEMVNCLSDKFNFKRVFLVKHKTKILNIPRIIGLYIYYRFIFTGNVILTNHTTWMAGRRSNNLVIIHHIDTSTSKGLSGLFQKMCDSALKWNKKYFKKVITVSNYWHTVLKKMGFQNSEVIYNSFNPQSYIFSREEIQSFKNKYSLLDKPIVYLGNCQRQKGVVDAYNALKDIDCHFITSGIKDVELPVTHLNLSFKEYRLLLASANVVICMSQLIEGWNRTAHEAMLSGTHVIGSGTGGMKELLEIGGGTICTNTAELANMVKEKLQLQKEDVSSELTRLDVDYFRMKWNKALDDFVKLSS